MSKKLSRRQFLQIAGVTTLAGALAACGKATVAPTPMDETEETMEAPTPMPELAILDYYWIGNGDTDQRPLVEAAINEYVGPLINANVAFHIIGWGDWATKALTGLQAGEKMDLFFTADWSYYMQEVTEGLFRPLNDNAGEFGNLLEEYGQGILATLNPAFITGTQIDGVNYAVPTNKELCVPEGFLYNVDVAEELGLTEEDMKNIKSYEDMIPLLEEAMVLRPDEYPYNTDGWDGFSPWPENFVSGYGDEVSMPIAPDANGVFDETIYSVNETDWAAEHFAMMRTFYEKGFIHPDAGLDTFDRSQYLNAGQFFINPQNLKGNNIKAQEMVNASGNPDLRLGEIYGQPKVNITVHSGGSMFAIPMLSDYAPRAMQYLNLMHTDSKLVNMQLFGVEGTHWEFEDDGRVNLIDSAWYGAHAGAWTVGNIMMQAVTNKEDPDKNRLLIEYADDALNHPSLGFRFRTEPVAAELTAIDAVTAGTRRALKTGYVDPAEVLPTYISDLKAAGLDTFVDEVKNQYAEWEKTKA